VWLQQAAPAASPAQRWGCAGKAPAVRFAQQQAGQALQHRQILVTIGKVREDSAQQHICFVGTHTALQMPFSDTSAM
jgi:hypothetical protein